MNIGKIVANIQTHQAVLNVASLGGVFDQKITRLASLSNATAGDLAFLSSKKYKSQLSMCKATAVLISPEDIEALPKRSIAICVASPYLAYAHLSQVFEKFQKPNKPPHIHPTAIIASSCKLGDNMSVGAYCVIGDGVVIGDSVCIGAGCVIADNVRIGANGLLYPQVFVGDDCVIGDNCLIYSHASIGSDGFGFAPTDKPPKAWVRIAQRGRVVIGNNVRIGANTCIDRGTLDDTIIGDDVIIDNQVQIAHNVIIGRGSAIAAQTGIAGSTTVGEGCIIGGAVGIVGHLSITDFVSISAKSFVAQSINQSGNYSSGTVAMPSTKWRRAAIKFRKMGDG